MSISRLIEAVQDGKRGQVAELLGAGTDVNGHGAEQEWPALNLAAGKGDLEMAKLLVANGADVFNVGRDRRTPYKIVHAAGRVEVARYLKQAEGLAGVTPPRSAAGLGMTDRTARLTGSGTSASFRRRP